MGQSLQPLAVGFVGTYPPTRCGIATFNASLAEALVSADPRYRFGVVACVDPGVRIGHASEVVALLVRGSVDARASAVTRLNEFDVVVLQHEFGIYGGEDGCNVLDLIRDLRVPVIVVLHTVLRRPTPGQRRIIEELAVLSDRLVVQSTAARARLLEQYVVGAEKVRTIPHGARANLSAERCHDGSRTPVVMTWGLLGPDKGIEWGIDAIAQLAGTEPAPRYLVVGQTHPGVLKIFGEQYRDALVARAAELGVSDLVEFDNAYHDAASLLERVRRADIVLLPYRSREQVVSGVLVEAIASGKAVVATPFPHAQELLAEGSGVVVPYEDSAAIAEALRSLLAEPERLARIDAVARRQASSLFWESVAERYLVLLHETVRSDRPPPQRQFPSPPFQHLLKLSDAVGVFEHAELTMPLRKHGYCTDDMARALVALLNEPRRTRQSPRANAFAVLGAAELVASACAPNDAAYALLEQAAAGLGRVRDDPRWPWPEPRLAYANAVLAEARIAAGVALDDEPLVVEGIDLLAWLVETETSGDHFSFTPVSGWAWGERRSGFDQQPIEAAAMADACARAFEVTGEQEWSEHGLRAAAWLLGANDLELPLLDNASGDCRDRLTPTRVNEKEGAESTIALITALQHARRLQAAARSASTNSATWTVAAPTQRSAAPYVR